MLGAPFRRQVTSITAAHEPALLEVLRRWVREAPVRDDFGVLRILAVRSTLRNLVRASGLMFRNFLLEALELDNNDLDDPNRLPEWKQLKLAALADASLLTIGALSTWYAQNPANARLAAIVSLDVCPLDNNIAKATCEIGQWLTALPLGNLSGRYLEQLQNSAFFVSYLGDTGRHDYKRAIVRQAMHMLQAQQMQIRLSENNEQRSQIRLTIVGELLFPQHAMFRCYAEALSELKGHFQVTLIADEPTRCPEHALFSHAQLYFPPQERVVARLAHLVLSTRPDIILYPSIGMSYWTFVLSLLRLAPLQLMSVGHPAPSCSEHIDGTLVYSELANSPLPEYGRLIPYDNQQLPLPLPMPPIPGWQMRGKSKNDNLVIAINAAQMKLTPQFLQVVEQALQSAPDRTELHFFPNAIGAELLALRRDLLSWFPHAVVHPATKYAEYMGELSKADIVLQSFPFGGTNTTIDALALGIPLICLQSEDLSASVDPVLLRRAGMSSLCATNEKEYLELTSSLLNSRETRMQTLELSQVGLKLLLEQSPPGSKTMADAILQTWQSTLVSNRIPIQ